MFQKKYISPYKFVLPHLIFVLPHLKQSLFLGYTLLLSHIIFVTQNSLSLSFFVSPSLTLWFSLTHIILVTQIRSFLSLPLSVYFYLSPSYFGSLSLSLSLLHHICYTELFFFEMKGVGFFLTCW